MWYLIRAAVKNVRINLGQLRIKRQIDSQLCDSIFAAYVQACLHVLMDNCFSEMFTDGRNSTAKQEIDSRTWI